MKAYIVIHEDAAGDQWETVFETLAAANKDAERKWESLSSIEKLQHNHRVVVTVVHVTSFRDIAEQQAYGETPDPYEIPEGAFDSDVSYTVRTAEECFITPYKEVAERKFNDLEIDTDEGIELIKTTYIRGDEDIYSKTEVIKRIF